MVISMLCVASLDFKATHIPSIQWRHAALRLCLAYPYHSVLIHHQSKETIYIAYPPRAQTVMSMEANFWEAKRYMRVVQRINDGATLCDELINMAKERCVQITA